MLGTRAQCLARGLAYKWQAAIIVGLGLFLAVLDSTIVSVALPDMRRTFNTDFNTVTWVVTAYFLAQAAVIPVMGVLSDRKGTKLVFTWSMGIFVLGSLLCAVAPSIGALVAARVVQGIGGGALMPISFAIAYRAFPKEEWGRATTTIGVPVLLAPALGPVIGGYLTTTFDWRAIFTINIPIGLIALFLASALLHGRTEDEAAGEEETAPQRFDVLGFGLAMIGFTLLVYGLTETGLNGWGSTNAERGLIAGALFLAALVVTELRVAAPVLDFRLFLSGTFARASILLWVVVAVFYGSLFLIPFYFEQVQGASPLTAGEILILQGVASAVGIAAGGELYNKVGPRVLAIAGTVALTVSTIGFIRLGVNTTGLSLQVWLVLRGLGLGLTTTPLQNLALSDVDRRDMARASSLVSVMRQVFAAAGLAVLTAILSQQVIAHEKSIAAALHGHLHGGAVPICAAAGSAGIPTCIRQHAVTMGLNDVFLVALAVCIGAVVLAVVVGRDATLAALEAIPPDELAQAFPRLTKDELIRTAGRMQPVAVPAGQTIVRQGDFSDRLYVITRGEVRVTSRSDAGVDAELRRMGPGQFFGEIGLLQSGPRTATVTAVERTEMLVMDQNTFSDVVSQSSDTAADLTQVIWQRLAVVP